MEIRVRVFLEARHGDVDGVVANRQLRHGVVSGIGAGYPEDRSIFQVTDLDGSIRDSGSRGVGNGSGDCSQAGLAKNSRSGQKKYTYERNTHCDSFSL